MNKAFLKEMETVLLEEQKKLSSELDEIGKEDPKVRGHHHTGFPNMGDKEDENAEEVDSYATNLTLKRTLEGSLRDVEKAIDRLAKGSYGTCKYCGKEIDEKRLRARPASSSCVECKKSFTQEV